MVRFDEDLEQQFFMAQSRFTPELRLGCVCIEHADQLSLDMAKVVGEPGNLALALFGSTAVAGGFVSIQMFRFPRGRSEFDWCCDWFGKNRKSRAKLPDGVIFESGVLAVREAPPDWDHEAYPQSNRKFVHIYRGKRQAVVIRWIARSGTILDNLLFKTLVDNLRIVPGQWVTDSLVVEPRAQSRPKATESRLTATVRTELDEAAARARQSLKLGRNKAPEKVVAAIHDAMDAFRRRKGTASDEKKQWAIDYGVLWGEALCAAAGWKWCHLAQPAEEPVLAVRSPTGSHAVAPLRAMLELLSHSRRPNNSLLLFNLIVSGRVPVAPANSYCWLW